MNVADKKTFFFFWQQIFIHRYSVLWMKGKRKEKNVCWGLLNTMFCPFTTTMAKPPAVDAKRNVEIKKLTGTWNTDIPGIVHVFLNQNKCKWICYDFVRMCRQSMCHTTHRFDYAMSIIASVHYTALHTQEHFVYLIQFSLNFSRFFLHSGWFNVFIVIDIIICELGFGEIHSM